MQISINKRTIELWHGATLKHALLKANEQDYKLVLEGKATMKDQYGNTIANMNGAVEHGMEYYIEEKQGDGSGAS